MQSSKSIIPHNSRYKIQSIQYNQVFTDADWALKLEKITCYKTKINKIQLLIRESYRHIDFNRTSGPEVFCKKVFLKVSPKQKSFTEKHLCRNLFFNKVAGLRP